MHTLPASRGIAQNGSYSNPLVLRGQKKRAAENRGAQVSGSAPERDLAFRRQQYRVYNVNHAIGRRNVSHRNLDACDPQVVAIKRDGREAA